MNALTLLRSDHDKVRKLLEELETTTERGVKTRQELFEQLKSLLTIHEIIEEEIFYPALKAHPKARDIVLEAFEEHNVVDSLLGQLDGLPPDDETWGAKATVMRENLEHHIEEEEGEMFATARRVFDRVELDALGRQMDERRRMATAELGLAS
jgi:hemerythrin-like domain-containing protein